MTGSFPWPNGKRCALSISFDDGRASQLDHGIPILDRHGLKGTFYVNFGDLDKRPEAWRAAYRNGHEMGNHTIVHPCSGNFTWSHQHALENYTLESMAAELDAASERLERFFGARPETFAYPCGQYFIGRGTGNRSYVPLVAERFLAARGYPCEAPNDPVHCDPVLLFGVRFDGLNFEAVRSLLATSELSGGWLILAGHDVLPQGKQSVHPETLEAVCAFAAEPARGIWMDTIANVARYVRSKRAPTGQ